MSSELLLFLVLLFRPCLIAFSGVSDCETHDSTIKINQISFSLITIDLKLDIRTVGEELEPF